MLTKLLEIDSQLDESIIEAVAILRSSGIVAFPTETVYGLGADVFDSLACSKIFEAKLRPSDSPLAAHISDLSQVGLLAREIPDEFYILAEKFMPGPISLIVPAKPEVPSIVTAGGTTIAFRFPDEPICQKLISTYGTPLAATSANLSGRPSPTHHSHVADDLGGRIPAVFAGGDCKFKIESTVLSLVSDDVKILRKGVIEIEQLESVLGKKIITQSVSNATKHPHYKPFKKVCKFDSFVAFQSFAEQTNEMISLISNYNISRNNVVENLSLSSETLYENLRTADKSESKVIVVLTDEFTSKNELLQDRLNSIINK